MLTAILILLIINLLITIIGRIDFGASIDEIKYVLGIKGTMIEKYGRKPRRTRNDKR